MTDGTVDWNDPIYRTLTMVVPTYLEIPSVDLVEILLSDYIESWVEHEGQGRITAVLNEPEDLTRFLFHVISHYYNDSEELPFDIAEITFDFGFEQLNNLYMQQLNQFHKDGVDALADIVTQQSETIKLLHKQLESLEVALYNNGMAHFREMLTVIVSKMEENGIDVRDDINEVCKHRIQ